MPHKPRANLAENELAGPSSWGKFRKRCVENREKELTNDA
jgi:hypothetical protein